MAVHNKTARPLVSVIVPFHNAQRTLRKTLLSLINQDFPKDDYEIILVDDGSTDSSVEEIKKIAANSPVPIRIIQQKHRGCYSARNLGAKNACGEVLAFIDADEVANRDWLKNLVRPFLMDEDLAVVCGKVVTDPDVALLTPLKIAPVNEVGLTTNGMKYATCNVAYRKRVFNLLGGFDEKFDPLLRGDSDLGLRVEENKFKIIYEPSAVVYHPVKEISFRTLFKLAKYRYHDVLLYAKHGKLAKGSLGNKIFQPIIGPFSLAGLSFIVVIVILAVLIYINPYLFLVMSLVSSLFWTLFFCFIGYKLLTSSARTPSLLLRIKSGLILPIYSLAVILARIYGSLRYRRLLL